MLVKIDDVALDAPVNGDEYAEGGAWHRFWARLFGRRMPTSYARAHAGNLLLRYRPGTTQEKLNDFEKGWGTDARCVYVIGDLWVFDYGNAPATVLTPKYKDAPQDMVAENERLLRENIREYPHLA